MRSPASTASFHDRSARSFDNGSSRNSSDAHEDVLPGVLHRGASNRNQSSADNHVVARGYISRGGAKRTGSMQKAGTSWRK
jgi:hypothetical protein